MIITVTNIKVLIKVITEETLVVSMIKVGEPYENFQPKYIYLSKQLVH